MYFSSTFGPTQPVRVMAVRPAGTGTGIGPHDAVGRVLNDPALGGLEDTPAGGGSVQIDVGAEQPDEFGRDVAEVTDRMLIYGQRHLRTVLAEYEAHYFTDREPATVPLILPRAAQRRPVLGGLIIEYQRAHRSPAQDWRLSSGTPQVRHEPKLQQRAQCTAKLSLALP